MSRVDELERCSRIRIILNDIFAREERLNKELFAIRAEFSQVQFSTDNVEEKTELIASRMLSIRDELNMLKAETKYLNATALWIKANLPK